MGVQAVPKAVPLERVLELLPHRHPFLMIDRILELDPGKRCVAIKNVSFNEPYLAGHFPGKPIMPGVLILESMAQAAGAAMLAAEKTPSGELPALVGVERARFRVPVRPGDTMSIETDVLAMRGRAGRAIARASVQGRIVAEAEITFALIRRDSL